MDEWLALEGVIRGTPLQWHPNAEEQDGNVTVTAHRDVATRFNLVVGMSQHEAVERNPVLACVRQHGELWRAVQAFDEDLRTNRVPKLNEAFEAIHGRAKDIYKDDSTAIEEIANALTPHRHGPAHLATLSERECAERTQELLRRLINSFCPASSGRTER